MTITRYMRIKDMLRSYMKKNSTRISPARLRKEIHKNIGSSEYRVIRPSIQMMLELSLIKDCGHYFEINQKEVMQ